MTRKNPKPVSPNVNRVIIYDPENRRSMYLDPVNGGAIPVIELEHSMTHLEKSFTVTIKEEKLKPSKKKIVYLRTTDDENEAHLTGNITVSKPVYVRLYENPSITDVGTPVKTFNNDRNSNKTPQLKVYEDSVANDNGELFLQAYITSKERKDNETILRRDTGYLIEIDPTQKNTMMVLVFTWYEAPIED